MSETGVKPSPERREETVLVIGIGNCLVDQKSVPPLLYDGVWDYLSHTTDGSGSLSPKSGLGGSLGAGRQGEYLSSRGGGGKNEGFVTMTGV